MCFQLSAGVKSTSIASKFLMNRESRMNRVEHARQMEMLYIEREGQTLFLPVQ